MIKEKYKGGLLYYFNAKNVTVEYYIGFQPNNKILQVFHKQLPVTAIEYIIEI